MDSSVTPTMTAFAELGTRTGTEWFLTSLKFLDRIATSLGLEVRVINDFAIDDE